jgi:hypothetical protein
MKTFLKSSWLIAQAAVVLLCFAVWLIVIGNRAK